MPASHPSEQESHETPPAQTEHRETGHDSARERFEDRVIDRHEGRKYARPNETVDRDSMRTEVERESHDTVGAPGMPVMTRSMGRGLVLGGLAGAVLGAVLFAPLGFIGFAGLDLGWRILIAASAGAVGGATAGSLYFGGRLPEVEGEMHDPYGRPTIASSERNNPDRGGLV